MDDEDSDALARIVAEIRELRIGDLPMALYAPIVGLLVRFVSGNELYDPTADAINPDAMRNPDAMCTLESELLEAMRLADGVKPKRL